MRLAYVKGGSAVVGRARSTILVLTGLMISGSSVPGASAPVHAQEVTAPPMVAAPRSGDVEIDGRLDEAAWQNAAPGTDFVQREPFEGRPAEHQTEARILFDEDAIYVGIRMFDDEPETIARQMVRRDEWGQYDFIEVAFDPNLDRRTGYLFRVSAAGVQRDEYLFEDDDQDEAWDAVWQSAVQIDSEGWTAEIRIPLSQMRYESSAEGRPWGVNFNRSRLQSNETSQYALISRLQSGIVSRFALLEGVETTASGRRIELRPYVLSRAADELPDPGNPFRDGTEYSAQTGIDLSLGLGSQFTLNATVNPDFGQVEADPAVINLTDFETFFQERRPFFVENASVFDFSLSGGPNRLYYSRRVGRNPHRTNPGGATFTDGPTQATILGAAKLTGRTSNGLSVGILAATTQEERGSAFFEGTGQTERFIVEPRTHFGVVRLQQDFNEGASTIGAIATTLTRNLPADGTFDFLPNHAFNGGIDWEHQWGERTWAWYGYLAGSHVRGSEEALLRIQRSSNHRFQRPDATRLSVDSTATTMSGIDWRMTLEKRRGDHWTGSVWAAQVTKGFEVNDLGFSSRQEVLDGGFRVSYQEIEPGDLFRSYNASFFSFHNWSHEALDDVFSRSSWGDAHVNGSFNLRGEVEFLNYWELGGGVSFRPERVDRSATRGGPLMLSPRSYSTSWSLGTDRRRAFHFNPGVSWEWSDLDGSSEFGISAEMTYRASSRVEIEVEPEWSSARNAAQYVTTSTTDPFPATFGSRYLFADLERRELAVETRLNVIVSPTLSFQLFAQPLLSSGDYLTYMQLSAPSSFTFDRFGEGTFASDPGGIMCLSGRTCVGPDDTRYVDFDGDGLADDSFSDQSFNVRSLIGNAVVRWEYRPGSTLFLVWQRRQRDRVRLGDFDLSRDVDALLGAPSENVFIVKLNYWLSL